MIPDSVIKILGKAIKVDKGKVEVLDQKMLKSNILDDLVWKAVFGEQGEKMAARWIIWEVAQAVGVKPAAIHDFYMARGKGRMMRDFTTPAMNLRGMAYDMARAVFKTVNKLKVGAFILELARSEMGYTDQAPQEYATVMLGAALREGYRGPVFIQGDHFQTKVSDVPGRPKPGEVGAVKKLIADSIAAGFYNIDIDTSTLVDLTRETEKQQQKSNIEHSLILAKQVRALEPRGLTISLGGEIGHIGGKNSTVSDFEEYIKGFNQGKPHGMKGMSKISVQTGTSHGGVVLADGSLAEIDVDFRVLSDISKVGWEKYGIAGAVQHGASTLPDQFFSKFTESEAVEVHLATGFQNIMMDNPAFPRALINKMYKWLDEEKQDERKEEWTENQFHYKLRKKAWGQFKKECWSIEAGARAAIRQDLEKRFTFLFAELNVVNTRKLVDKFIKAPTVNKSLQEFASKKVKDVKGLAD